MLASVYAYRRIKVGREMRYIHQVEQRHADRVFLIPWKGAEAPEVLAVEAAMTGAIHE